jgi:SsrA-binding protein
MNKILNKNKNVEKSIVSISKNSHFDIKVIENFTAGIVLSGNEIKSLRTKDVSIKESYILSKNGELYIFNMYIAPYKNANAHISENFDIRPRRKLLMKKSEIRKISKQSKEKGYIISPIKIFINERG